MDNIQMTEEQAREILKSLGGYNIDINMDYGIEKLKQAGYITRPAWEDKFKEAEKTYVEWEGGPGANEDELIRLLHTALLAAVDRIKELA